LVQPFDEKPESDDTLYEIAYRCEEMQRPVLKKQGHHGTEGTHKAEKTVDRGAICPGFVVSRPFVFAVEAIKHPGNSPTARPWPQPESLELPGGLDHSCPRNFQGVANYFPLP
jgi:hypothetical protein